MNAQYLIVHECVAKLFGVLDNGHVAAPSPEDGLDCDWPADVKIYGRTAVITPSVRRMLVDIATPRSCVDLSHMHPVKQNGEIRSSRLAQC